MGAELSWDRCALLSCKNRDLVCELGVRGLRKTLSLEVLLVSLAPRMPYDSSLESTPGVGERTVIVSGSLFLSYSLSLT